MKVFRGSFSSINKLRVPLPQNLKHQTMALMGKRSKSCVDLRESLLNEELSDGPRVGKCKDVPKGFLAVYVGPYGRRYVIRASYISLPDFRELIETTAEEFGFESRGGLKFPCEEEVFEEVLVKCLRNERLISNSKITSKQC